MDVTVQYSHRGGISEGSLLRYVLKVERWDVLQVGAVLEETVLWFATDVTRQAV